MLGVNNIGEGIDERHKTLTRLHRVARQTAQATKLFAGRGLFPNPADNL